MMCVGKERQGISQKDERKNVRDHIIRSKRIRRQHQVKSTNFHDIGEQMNRSTRTRSKSSIRAHCSEYSGIYVHNY